MTDNKSSTTWFCLIPAENLRIAKRTRVWGVPDSPKVRGRVKLIKPGDLLYFYVIHPTKAISARSIAESSVFVETEKAPWSDRFYPFRIRLGPVKDLKRPIPFSSFVGKISRIRNRFGLFGMTLIPLTKD